MTDPAGAAPKQTSTKRTSSGVHIAWPMAAIAAISYAAGNIPQSPAPQPAPTVVPLSPTPTPGGTPSLMPLMSADNPVQWWFAYKFSAQTSPGNAGDPGRACPFGGTLRCDGTNFSQRYVVANSLSPALRDGSGLIGTSTGDPLGATFNQIYSGNYYFVVWNDQFYNDPPRTGPECDAQQCGKPWGHSKGVLAWDQNGNGLLIQVTTPSWPGAGSGQHPRADGDTLGCISDDNNLSNAQDFFALQLSRSDVKTLLQALAVASVSTDVNNPQIVNRRIAGQMPPSDLDQLVGQLGQVSGGKTYFDQQLSSGIRLIAKPSALHVPPWQFVSSVLGTEPLLTATWWAYPKIDSTRSIADVHCWDPQLTAPPGEVDVALTGSWAGTPLKFTGGPNHAKVGVSLAGGHNYAIFGDLDQQGQLGSADTPNGKGCDSSQNGRGGMFFVVANQALATSVSKMITGTTAPYPN